MADGERERTSLAAVASYYKTVVTRHAIAGPVLGQRLLAADVRRWSLRVLYETFGAIAATVFPGPLPANMVLVDRNTATDTWEFRDCPAAVTGEWFAFTGAAISIVTVETLFVG